MCDLADGTCDIWNETVRTARKAHRCFGCKAETIRPGDRYVETRTLFDGSWEGWKHCMRCHAMWKAIHAVADFDEHIDPGLDCGETWESAGRGVLPERIAALAFWLPGEPLPEATP